MTSVNVLTTQPPAGAEYVDIISVQQLYRPPKGESVTAEGLKNHPAAQVEEVLKDLANKARLLLLLDEDNSQTELHVYGAQVTPTPDGKYLVAYGTVYIVPKRK